MHVIGRFSAFLATVIVLLAPGTVLSQNDVLGDARAAMTRGEYARAANLLSAAVTEQPSADAYVYLGISYAHLREWMRAEDTLKTGATRYPEDPRFHNELAGVYLAANDLERARQSLRTALDIDPSNKYANDLLATIDMSMGNVESALTLWNKADRPVVGDVLHNGHVEFENWIIGKASAFRPGEKLTWGKWKTTETRLVESRIYSNVGVEIEPTPVPDRYTAVIRTSPNTNSRQQLVMPLLETLFFADPSLNVWNVGNTATTIHSRYRFATNRHRAQVGFHAPLPLPGLFFFEAMGIYRSERWDISEPAIETGIDHRFYFQSTGFRVDLKHIPHYRFELGVGLEYRNRTASGSQPGLALDNRNTGKLLVQASILPFAGRYRSRIRGEGFLARRAFLSDIDYSGGTVEWNNRFIPDERGLLSLEITAKAGTSRGSVPVDDYFLVGIQQFNDILLRGHNTVDDQGHFGNGPMGTSFGVLNTTFDGRIRRIPLLNTLGFPWVDLKWQIFADAGRTYDRADIFEEGKTLVDVGAGFKLETPTRVFNLTYGHSLRDGTGTLAAYVGRRW
jgi:hypothetical protein